MLCSHSRHTFLETENRIVFPFRKKFWRNWSIENIYDYGYMCFRKQIVISNIYHICFRLAKLHLSLLYNQVKQKVHYLQKFFILWSFSYMEWEMRDNIYIFESISRDRNDGISSRKFCAPKSNEASAPENCWPHYRIGWFVENNS